MRRPLHLFTLEMIAFCLGTTAFPKMPPLEATETMSGAMMGGIMSDELKMRIRPTWHKVTHNVSVPVMSGDGGKFLLDVQDVFEWLVLADMPRPKSANDLLEIILPPMDGIENDAPAKECAPKKRDGALKLPTRAMLDKWGNMCPFDENVGKHRACIAFADWLVAKGYFAKITERTLEKLFTWNNATLELEPNEKALQRGFETCDVENS